MERDRCTTVRRFPGSRPPRGRARNQHKETRISLSPAGKYARCTIVLVSMRADLTEAVQGQGQGRWDAGDALI
jgi:hypothetical protein